MKEPRDEHPNRFPRRDRVPCGARRMLTRLEAIDKKLEQACAAVGVQINP